MYVPIDPPGAVPDDDVRVELTDEAVVRFARDLGALTPRVEGRLVPLGSDSLGVAVWIGQEYQGTPFQHARQLVPLAFADVVRMERRTLSRMRTSLLAAVAAGGLAVMIRALVHSEDPNPPTNGDPPLPPDPPDGLRIRLGG